MNTNRTENKGESFEIVGGPNKDLLFDACKYAYSRTAKVPVEFSIVLGSTMPEGHSGGAYLLMPTADFRICGIQHEDGSGESFNLSGYCKAQTYWDKSLQNYRFKIYFNNRTRKGIITLFKQ
ncbi:hypothetical protein IJH72_01960 [Candidatus Saccharibacteria bacterium]|nr:hypothetical protein [Candidatus Saccharibacteria bacterium]